MEYYNVYTDSLLNKFDSAYRAKCLQAYQYERFTVTHDVSEYHYTLYYYDHTGKLLKTIPCNVCRPLTIKRPDIRTEGQVGVELGKHLELDDLVWLLS